MCGCACLIEPLLDLLAHFLSELFAHEDEPLPHAVREVFLVALEDVHGLADLLQLLKHSLCFFDHSSIIDNAADVSGDLDLFCVTDLSILVIVVDEDFKGSKLREPACDVGNLWQLSSFRCKSGTRSMMLFEEA